jgi:hypothetical protein
MITKQMLTDSMITLATELRLNRENHDDFYYVFAQALADMLHYAHENNIHVCDADLWYSGDME